MPQLSVSKNEWEKEFSNGRWNYLESTPGERARSAIIGMYCQYYAPNGSILDVGCGLGTTVDFLSNEQKKNYLGLDISEEAIKKAQAKHVQFQSGDFNTFIPPSLYDVIIFNEVLYYMNENVTLQHAQNMLTPEGILIVSLYHTKENTFDKEIWKAVKKMFKTIDAITISSNVKNSEVTWKVEVLAQL